MTNKKKEVVKQKSKPQNSSIERNRFYLIFLFIFSFIIYGNTFQNEYALDDGIVITQNHFVQKGIAGIPDILTHDSFFGWLKGANNDVAGGRYRPLSLVSFAIENSIFGNNPGASHFINVLLYAVLGMSVFILLNRLLIIKQTQFSNLIHLPFLTALLFIAHPVHTEAVANIKGRDEILSLLFSIIAIINFIKYIDEEKNKNLFTGFLFLFLGMLSKENAITFSLIIPISVWFFRSPSYKQFFILTGVILSSAAIFLLLRQTFANPSLDKEVTELLNNPFYGSSSTEKFATIIYTFGKYLWLILLPVHLTNDYYPFHIEIQSFSSSGTLISLFLCLTILTIGILQIRKKTIISFSVLFFAITFSVVSNIFFPIGTFMSERFLFTPSLGYCLLLAYFISLVPYYKSGFILFKKSKNYSLTPVSDFFKIRKIQIILILIIGFYSTRTIARNFAWKNNYTLFSADINTSPNSANAHHAIATEFRKAGEKSSILSKRNEFYTKAILEDKKAIEIYPNFTQAYYNIGVTNLQMDNVQSAKTALKKSLEIAPKYADALNNLGYCYIQENKIDSALIFCHKASKIDTGYFRPYSNLGAIYLKKMDIEKAYYYFQKAHILEPNDPATSKAFDEISSILRSSN